MTRVGRSLSMFDVILVIGGLVALFVGGEFLVKGASNLATALGMSRLLVGLTIVAIGTSAPEMAISIDAVRADKPGIAFGNIVGSNISNVLLILGLTAVVIPVSVRRQITVREIPVMIGVTLLFYYLSLNGQLSRFDGVVLLLTMAAFLYYQIAKMRGMSERFSEHVDSRKLINNESADETQQSIQDQDKAAQYWMRMAKNSFWILLGGAFLWMGSTWLVSGASGIATSLGVSELVIGLTIVAIGSSSPEIATSLIAALRGHSEMAIGNVLGSNISNLTLVGGAMALMGSDLPVPAESIQFDLPIMLATAVVCLPVCWTSGRIDRWEGAMFLCSYVLYLGILYAKTFLESMPNIGILRWPIIAILVGIAVSSVLVKFFRKNSRKRTT